MKKELSAQLYLRFTELFAGRNKPLNESLMGFGFECGSGWYKLIYQLCEDLEKDSKEEGVDIPEVMQVKEKLGGLRFYVTGATSTMFDLIDEAESKSESICEVCGDKAERFSDGGWIKTRCKKHQDS